MKKIFLVFLILTLTASSVNAAKYTVNKNGIVKSDTGTVQKKQNIIQTQNMYNNYNAQTYVDTKQATAGNFGIINIVMDYSGSMSNWIEVAKYVMTSIINQLPASTKIGLRVFGYDNGQNPSSIVGTVKNIVKNEKNGKYKVKASVNDYLGKTTVYCSATSQMARIESNNTNKLLSAMNSAVVGGATPLTYALHSSVFYDFTGFDVVTPKKIILITDGGETCGGDPCEFAKNLVAKRKDIVIDVVLVSSNSQALKCLTNLTGGELYNVFDAPGFIMSFTKSMTAPVPESSQQNATQNYEFIKN